MVDLRCLLLGDPASYSKSFRKKSQHLNKPLDLIRSRVFLTIRVFQLFMSAQKLNFLKIPYSKFQSIHQQTSLAASLFPSIQPVSPYQASE